jgi:uncharacterized protein (TIGR03000 family)
LAVPVTLHAGGGGHGGGGGFHGGGFYGGYGRGFYGSGYGRGFYGGYGRGFYGYGGGYYGLYPFGFAPYDYGSDYYPGDYPYGGAYGAPDQFAGASQPPTDTQSFYPPDAETAPRPGEANRALVSVHLPSDAGLWFQGTQMPLTGSERVFRSPPLALGKSYRYDVTARWTENGRPVEKNRSISVQAGQRVNLDMTSGD